MTPRDRIIAALRATGERLSMLAIRSYRDSPDGPWRVYHHGAAGKVTMIMECDGGAAINDIVVVVADCIDEINAQRAAEDAAQQPLLPDDRGPR